MACHEICSLLNSGYTSANYILIAIVLKRGVREKQIRKIYYSENWYLNVFIIFIQNDVRIKRGVT